MRTVVLASLTACGFQHGAVTPPPGDALIDMRPLDTPLDMRVAQSALCPVDPTLLLCYSFDQQQLATSLPNEGMGNVFASLTNVNRIVSPTGGAAQLDATSTIFVPEALDVTGIQSIEVWFRADSMPATDLARMGLLDSNTSTNISLFLYRVDPAHELRCGIGDEARSFVTTLQTGTWTRVACVCDGDSLLMYVNDVLIGDQLAPCASGGTIVADGLTIGANNTGGMTPVNDWLLGAIDGVRLWNVAITP